MTKVQEALKDDEYTKYCDAKIANGATVNQIMSRQDWHYCWNKSQAALSDIEKCEPVAEGEIIAYRLTHNKSGKHDIYTVSDYAENHAIDESNGWKFEPIIYPPQPRDWVELSDESVHELIAKYHPKAQKGVKKFEVTDWWRFANAIDAACKQLNTKG